MSEKEYIIYDQEPVKALIDVPLLFGFILFFLFVIILPFSEKHNQIFMYLLLIIDVSLGFYLISLWSKLVTSNKLRIVLSKDLLEISTSNKQIIKIHLSEIVRTETKSNGRFDHYKIYYSNNRIFAISKFSLYWVCDDLEHFKKDLENTIKKHN